MKGVCNFGNTSLVVSLWKGTWLMGHVQNNSHNNASRHPCLKMCYKERSQTYLHFTHCIWVLENRVQSGVLMPALRRCSPVRRKVMHIMQDMFNGATELSGMGLMIGMRCTLKLFSLHKTITNSKWHKHWFHDKCCTTELRSVQTAHCASFLPFLLSLRLLEN
jgi:hypothetical protein